MRKERKRRILKKITCKHKDEDKDRNGDNIEEMVKQMVEDIVEKVMMDDKEVEEMSEEELDAEIEMINTRRGTEEEILRNCSMCGPGIEEIELCMMGLDVTALFPSMS